MTPKPRELASWTWVLIASLVACTPILAFGYPMGHDWVFGLVRVVEYREALRAGQLPPMWVLHQYQGLGSLLFLFYGHGFLALSALVGLVVGDPIPTAAATLVLTSVIAASGAFLWGRAAFGPGSAARVTAVAFALGPYLACNRLLRTSNAELMGLCWMPLAFAGVASIRERPRAGLLCIGLGLGAAIASHNMVALYGVGAILAASVIVLHDDRAALSRALLGVAFALGVSAFYWLPAFVLTGTIQAASAGTYFAVTDSFVTPAQWAHGEFFSLGAPLLVAVVAGFGVVLRAGMPRHRRWATAGASACAIALWMTTPSSAWLWENAPLLPYFQFSWRIFGLFSLGAPIVLGAAVATLAARGPRVRQVAEIVAVLACAASFVPLAQRAEPIAAELRPRVEVDLAPERLRAIGMSATVGDQFVPAGAHVEAARLVPRGPGGVSSIVGTADVAVAVDLPERTVLGVRATEPVTLTFARFAYPTWRVEVDGSPVAHRADANGLLVVEVPAGEHVVALGLQQPPIRRAANAGSAITLVLLLLAARRLPAGSAGISPRRPSA